MQNNFRRKSEHEFFMLGLVADLSERIDGQRTPFYIFEIWADNGIIYHKIVGSYGKMRQKDIEEAMHDLSKYNRQEWKYTRNKP